MLAASDDRWVVVLGGTGLVGSALCRQLVEQGQKVVIVARTVDNGVDGSCNKFGTRSASRQVACDLNLPLAPERLAHLLGMFKIGAVVNATRAAGRSTAREHGQRRGLFNNVLAFVDQVKATNHDAVFVNLGSVAEFSSARQLSAYQSQKKTIRASALDSCLVDYHVIVGIVFGGNSALRRDLQLYQPILRLFPDVLCSFKLDCVHSVELAGKLTALILGALRRQVPCSARLAPVEVRVLGHEMPLLQLFAECDVELTPAGIPIDSRIGIYFARYIIQGLTLFNRRYRRLTGFFSLAIMARNVELQEVTNHYVRNWRDFRMMKPRYSIQLSSGVILHHAGGSLAFLR